MDYRTWICGINDALGAGLNTAECNRAALCVPPVPERASGKLRVRGEVHWVTEDRA